MTSTTEAKPQTTRRRKTKPVEMRDDQDLMARIRDQYERVYGQDGGYAAAASPRIKAWLEQ